MRSMHQRAAVQSNVKIRSPAIAGLLCVTTCSLSTFSAPAEIRAAAARARQLDDRKERPSEATGRAHHAGLPAPSTASSIPCGRRSEIVAVDGFRFGKTARRALDQSKYPVESAVAQNSRSSSSERKDGIGLGCLGRDFGIGISFLAAYRSR